MASLNKLDDSIDSLSDALADILQNLKRKHLDLQKTQNVPAVRSATTFRAPFHDDVRYTMVVLLAVLDCKLKEP